MGQRRLAVALLGRKGNVRLCASSGGRSPSVRIQRGSGQAHREVGPVLLPYSDEPHGTGVFTCAKAVDVPSTTFRVASLADAREPLATG